jgi:hypothetical protein
MDGLSHIAHVFGIKANHRNPAIFKHVDVMGIDEMKRLRFTEACIRKHAYLISDVMPAAWSLLLFQFRSQTLTHGNYPFSNALQLFTPFLEIGLVVKDLVSDSCTSKRWGGILGSNDHFDLAQHPRACLFVRSNYVKSSNSFSIKSHVLGIRLSD